MDYDDNDFQSQNRHLAGEGSNKFPPVLRPYALPKFEFDDNLHGPLRFDNLVETEVFLGIESNEDSQWIEDYSRGSPTIQFTSSAAESCCISRQNNVWSEATSSESVEMLLRSVVQEESVPLQVIAKKSNACDEQGCMISQMEPNLNQDSNLSNRTVDFADVKPMLVPCDIDEGFSGSPGDVGGQLPLAQDVSCGHEGGNSVDIGLGDFTGITPGGGLSVTVESTFIDSRCDSVGQNAVNTVVYESLAIRTQESDASGMQIDMVDTGTVIREEDEDVLNRITDSSDGIKNMAAMDVGDPIEETGALCEGDAIGQTQDISDATVIEAGSEQLQNPACSSPAEYESEANVSGNSISNMEGSCISRKDVGLSENINATDVSRGSESISLVSLDGRTTETRNGSNSVPQLQTDSFVTSSEEHLISEENDTSADRTERCNVPSAHGSDDSDFVAAKASEGTPSSSAAETPQGHERVMVPQNDEDKRFLLDTPFQLNTSSEHTSNGVAVNNEVHGSPTTDRDIGSLPVLGIEGEALGIESLVDAAGGNEIAGSADPSNSEVSSLPGLESVLTAEEAEKEISNSELRTSEGTAAVNPLTESEMVSADASEKMLSAPTDESLPIIGHCTHEGQVESEAVPMNEDARECTKAIEECSDHHMSANKDNDTSIIREAEEKTLLEAPESMDKVGLSDNNDSSQNATQQGYREDKAVLSTGLNDKPDAVASKNELATSADPEKQPVPSPTIATTPLPEVQHQREETKRSSHPCTPAPSSDANRSSPKRSKMDVPSKDDGSFTFQVPSFTESPQTENAKKMQVVQTVEINKASMVPSFTGSPQTEIAKKLPDVKTVDTSKVPTSMDGSPSTSGLVQLDAKVVQDLSHQSPKVSDITVRQSAPKVNSERKPRRSRATGKESAKRGRTTKVTTPAKVERGNNANIPPGSPGLGHNVYSNEMQLFGHIDSSGVKPFVGTSIPGLPDLNSSATTTLFQQPFTDTQQVQLRAQIFVYGSLIQGTAPEEAYMISAFGGADGGKSAWEKNWRLYVERLNTQRSHLSTPETPVQSHSGVIAPEQTSKQSTRKGKATGSRSSSKATASTIPTPMLPLSSPIWNMPTPSIDHLQSSSTARAPVLEFQRALSPLHPHQTPAMKNLVAHSPSWISQGPFGAWITSPQTSAVETGSRFPVQMAHTEPVHLTPAKDSFVSHTSVVKHVSTLVSHAASSGNVLPSTSMPDVGKAIISSGQQSTAPKPRRRKKSLAPENIVDRGLNPEPPREIVPGAAVSSHLSTSVSIITPASFVSKAPAEMAAFPSPLTTNFRKEDPTRVQRANSSDEALGKVKEARSHAEDAAAFAATAVGQSQLVWSQLDKQRDASLSSDVEAKLASAAVAIAAAAAVAKAAAAAANVAANAALQAKLMADEAAASGIYNGQSSLISFSNDTGNATPASILKRDNGTSSSSSVISAARETARKRVEAASAASKRAENMDAIIRAAELAAEAVSQAGKIIDMGDPLPLSELVAAGPEGFWKVSEVSPQLVAKSNEIHAQNLSGDRGGEIRDASVSHEKASIAPREISSDDHVNLVDNSHVATGIKDAKGLQAHKPSEIARTLEVVLQDGSRPKSPTNTENEHVEVGSSEGSGIKEGSFVEILRDGNGFKAAWFSAKVLNLRDEMAYVSYDELTLGEGSEKLKEWVALRGEGAEAPKIRISRPLTVMPFEGTRKRRRAAINDYNWSVGDRVDAWIRESWWEGVVTEKNKKDDTTLTVYFPVQGETSVVKAWHLRTSLLWSDGQWIEWSNSSEKNVPSHLGDTPQEKRPRIWNPVADSKDKDKVPKNANVDKEPAEPTLLDLASEQKIFNMGKSTGVASRMARTGLQAEGSNVVFGVPKPGKKRKFMEVSKHYVGGARSHKTTDETNDPSSKFPRWRGGTTSRTDTTVKRSAIPKPRVPKLPGKTSGHAQAQGSTTSGDTTVAAFTDLNAKTKNASGSGGGSSGTGKQSSIDFRAFSSSEGTPRAPVVFSSVRQPDAVPTKKPSTVNARGERGSKGKFSTGVGKLGRVEERKASAGASSAGETSGAEAPRRSNRRIQPTSRLLEGLQSSLMVSKIPSVSHDKSHKSRPAARGKAANLTQL
ncbi:unnamed protein product [Linum tenue]|uniref:Agenet domain-containing protein n=1 Tax=Linum tenue TaxID=586396 RepID=A0AAV0JWK0_9ROSI|nr:unnamed protein product [Linum tenue]